MPYCPNPECPFRKRFGESAEYRSEISTCSDCGASLSEKDILGPVQQKEKSSFTLTETHKRILWTIMLVVFWRILSHLSLPGIDYDFLSRKGAGTEQLRLRFSIFSLGLLPYVSAYILIEMLSLFVQPLKRWRQEGTYEKRAHLVRAARWMTLIIALYHGNALLTSMAGMAGGQFFIDKSTGFHAVLLLTLVTGTFLTVWIADLISSKGIGHGVSILIITAYLSNIPRNIEKMIMGSDGIRSYGHFGLWLIAMLGLVVLMIYMERSKRNVPIRFADGVRGIIPLKFTTAGTEPASWANSTLALPFVVLSYIGIISGSDGTVPQWFAQNFFPGSLVRSLIYAVLVIMYYYVFTAFFYDRKEISRFLSIRGASAEAPFDDKGKTLDRSLERMALIGSFYLIGLSFAHEGFWKWLGVPPILEGLNLLIVVCVSFDLISEISLRWRSKGLVEIAEFHETWKAGMLQSLLQVKGVPSVIRGYHHRALLYFFGPYIEMSLLVPREQAEAAQAILNDYFPSIPTAGT